MSTEPILGLTRPRQLFHQRSTATMGIYSVSRPFRNPKLSKSPTIRAYGTTPDALASLRYPSHLRP